ncbi:hypothetical protein [Spirulina sp. 06S082]|uniref:hypothetical protein n=1 Tax=Spirulina sp. 06S082 TaxID=3110248 RepID=UPI002B20FAA5|nr:hypothetical protein [Spirulina sp. 06S082]
MVNYKVLFSLGMMTEFSLRVGLLSLINLAIACKANEGRVWGNFWERRSGIFLQLSGNKLKLGVERVNKYTLIPFLLGFYSQGVFIGILNPSS